MVDLTRRNLMASSVAAAVGASVAGVASASDADTPGAPSVRGSIKRFSTTAYGAEVTGPFVFEDGSLLYSLQHPDPEANSSPFDRGGVGYFSGFTFEFDGSNDDFEEVSVPESERAQRDVRSASGDYEMLFHGRDPIGDGSERLGVPQTPDGTDLTEFEGSSGGYGLNPDCNQFVATNDDGTEGYLFTNWENYPGAITRVPLAQSESGEWTADLAAAMNVVNTPAFRDLGGTWVNCYGDLSPWNTMISAEENYSHPRISYGHTVSEWVETGSGVGLIGGCQFWNRPDPSAIGDAITRYAEAGDLPRDFDPHAYWSQGGVEKLAYYLGADPVDQTDTGNDRTPIDDRYPNPYRYGYFVDIRSPAGDPPEPIKYWVMGRAAWEAPDIQRDERTVYMCSDGDNKGVYKFVADEPIPSYDDPADIAGTLYAPKITPEADGTDHPSPARTPLQVEWLELGHATNGEVESWIAQYDDVTQADYLDAHARTDWREDFETALREADLAVIESGNQSYISNEDIVAWATQYRAHGPDGVDDDLRKVPFLETRAAAKEIGASIEFNKAEGVDSVDDAQPGDYVYFGIAEFNDALADDAGDIQLDRVDGGVVYRAELEPDYNVSRLEPVIAGPDFTDGPTDADDAIRNVDNVYAMRDGRVLCCEDGFGGPARSYPNDGLYVYQPTPIVDVESVAIRSGTTASADVTASMLPEGFSGARLTVTVADPAVVEINSVAVPDDLGLTASTVGQDGATATLTIADLNGAIQAGAIDRSLATLELSPGAAGTTDLSVTIDRLDDESGSAIDAEADRGVVVTGPPSIMGERPPTDPDGDGRYEDLNGNGRLDYSDVVALFNHLDADSVALNTAAFDFNENGRMDFDDVVDLFEEV
ncbi:MAG: alkaline phosphatase PhoX [Halococcoides sp.]